MPIYFICHFCHISAFCINRAYRRETKAFARYQIALVGVSVFTAFLITLIFSAVLPTFFSSSNYNFISQFFFVVLAYGFLSLYANHQNLFIKKAMKNLLQLPFFDSIDNVLTLQRLLTTMQGGLSNGRQPFIEQFQFHRQQTNSKGHIFYFSNELPDQMKKTNLQHHFPIQGYLETIERLERGKYCHEPSN